MPTQLTIKRKGAAKGADAERVIHTATFADDPASVLLRPEVQSAVTLVRCADIAELDLGDLVSRLEQQCCLASAGDMARSEAFLISQAHTLDAIFNRFARAAYDSEYLNHAETCLRLALKAQSQCCTTLETLSAMKSPKSFAFVNQANIAQGPQQVNNSAAPPAAHNPAPGSRERKSENEQNKLLEQSHGERLVSSAPKAPVTAHRAMASVAVLNGSSDA